MGRNSSSPQTLLIDADDTLWENNIYFERAIADFISFLNHRERTPAEVREILNEAFRAEGHDVVEATTGAEAIKRLDNDKFDLMVCDLGLPELSGLHVARWVKQFRPDLPVIIATGFAEMIAEEDYENARIDEIIRKPYAVADVLARANAVLAKQLDGCRESVTF